MHLEECIRNIDIALYYFDSCGEYFSTKVRNKIISMWILASASVYPKHDFYRKKLLEVDFTIENVQNGKKYTKDDLTKEILYELVLYKIKDTNYNL